MGPRRCRSAALATSGVVALAGALSRCWAQLGEGRRASLTAAGAATAVGLSQPQKVFGAPAQEIFDSAGGSEQSVVLKNGLIFPKASFGPQAYSFNGDGKARELTQAAVLKGYRNFFSSVDAHNQRGFAQGIQDSAIARQDLFICGSVDTKGVKGFDKAYRETKKGCDENLQAFAAGGIDYVDMIMLDYPAADCDSIKGQWKAFEEMLAAGKTRSLGVSNFGLTQLDCILKDPSLTPPAVNQLRYNAEAYDPATAAAIVAENRKRGVAVQAWSPLRVSDRKKKLAEEIGKAYGKTFAQVLLRWIIQMGATYTTQSSKIDRLGENVDIFDFALSDSDVQRLSA
ncbi:unnamed protein product [Polarella glacialis]|uniref:NADP-dependent oxidoreductase domain-containing protein n=1 Tax=Polarella glacialis TaxID=89957 RepID=A0A813KJU6_POLGL|nr:unnamed protein product [Polarella glacialis]